MWALAPHPRVSGSPNQDASQPNYRCFSLHHLSIMDPREAAIELAICGYNARIYTSQVAAAKAYGIPRTTFQDRLKGAPPAINTNSG
jgi:hypothetical protein